MTKSLVIVESPAKAKTIGKYLGKDYIVEASVGHVKDLPSRSFGVDLENGFLPEYEVIKGKKKIIDAIKAAAKRVDQILLAPDPDREGEAIAWHIAEEIRARAGKGKVPHTELVTSEGAPIRRVLFNEITKKAIQDAIAHPVAIDQKKFEAQQARRILDRIVGYKISPLLWEKVRRGLSAGRVQSVAVRLVCEREQEVLKFVPEEYWSLEIKFEGSQKPVFVARLDKKDGKKIELKNKEETDAVLIAIQSGSFTLADIIKKEQRRHPTPPFITSKLQQEAARKLGFSAKKTMTLAQRLYEGVEIDTGEVVGLITYMRTDSVRVSDQALGEVRDFIAQQYGAAYLPSSANVYKTKKDAQNAHEAIRPTSMAYTPDRVKSFLDRDQLRLYELIWKRFVASQMTSAVFDSTVFVIQGGTYEFRANGSILKFPGFIKVYQEGRDEATAKDGDDNEDEKTLPLLEKGEILKALEYLPAQHFTQPPPRYTEASLVKELEERGIGRPSTYAAIMSTILDKEYVEKLENKFRPTQLGTIVNDLLVNHFPHIMDISFTARMEEELDEVEEGGLAWTRALSDFYEQFTGDFSKAQKDMPSVKRQEIKTDFTCEKCGAGMVIKFGRNGEFLACSNYPDCKSTSEFKREADGTLIKVAKETATDEICDKCGSPMVIKTGRYGKFLACSAYPKCESTRAISLGVNCPTCGKPIAEKRSRRGKPFYGCTGYPNCNFASWDKPVAKTCPLCASPYLLMKVTKSRGTTYKCPNKDCAYEADAESSQPTGA